MLNEWFSARGRTQLATCLLVAAAIVALQSIVPLTSEQYFDSDQAACGLMAKHLSEGRAFPLFFYGQNYLLGVQTQVDAHASEALTLQRMPCEAGRRVAAWCVIE